jgi:hypothetical protein
MTKFSRIFFIFSFFIFAAIITKAQVNAVTFGKNRVQYKKFKWEYYQTKNFNVYFNAGGKDLAKFVAQVAEKELPQIEAATEYSLQRRANIILYNEYADMQQTNIGLETDILNTGAVTRLVNNKMVIYFDANHYNLKRQVRQGIADVITKNLLFGDDIGEVASNQALLDLPTWLTDGYVAYIGENWSTDLDDELKSEILSNNFTKFSKFAYYKPLLAGHAFWYYIEEKYKKENVTYFLYLARIYKNLDKASRQITKLKFKQLQAEFMEYSDDKYSNDITRRKAYPKGSFIDGFDISKRLNYYRFNVNPNKKNSDYVVTEFKKGIVRLKLNTGYDDTKVLLKYGVRTRAAEINPSYPLVAWDPKGTRIAVAYTTEGHLKLFIYDVVNDTKPYKFDLTDKFDQIQDVKYMLDSRTLLFSAVKNGHTDIYSFEIETEKIKQITNDVYDDVDPSFVSFPGKIGIIYSSNRPSADAKTADTVLPSNNRYNVFLITDFGGKAEVNQITQLTKLKYGNARYPTPYNNTHFTFVSDENGIGNRYAGFFTTKAEGLDTLVIIGDEILRNPNEKTVDSTLRANKKADVDSIAIVAVSSDSTYIFPLTNYPSSLAESRVAGENNQLSEVTRESDEKLLYKLKIDENTLRRRNINATPTEYAKKLMRESKLTNVKIAGDGKLIDNAVIDTAKKQDDFFQTEFANEKADTSKKGKQVALENDNTKDDENVLAKAKLYKYKPLKFSVDYGSGGFNSGVLYNRYQTYGGGAGPIRLGSSSPISGLIRMGTSDLMEDIKINGGFRIGSGLKDNEWLLNYQNLKRRLDWGLTYYRNVTGLDIGVTSTVSLPGKSFTNLYQVNISYPFDVVKSLRFSTAIRSDKVLFSSVKDFPATLIIEDEKTLFSMSHLEFVYDNSQILAQNIMEGARGKIFIDWNRKINKTAADDGPNSFNIGFDGRYYHQIYRNFIWAGRIAGDFSFGDQKIAYYLGGSDGWLMFGNNVRSDGSYRFFTANNPPAADQNYAFQSLAVNMRGFVQNIASGNNAVVFNSEFRLPLFTTIFDRTINSSFIRNFQLTQFIDLGTAWAGGLDKIKRPVIAYTNADNNVTVRVKAGGIGPLAGGYGFGARTMLLGYFVKYDISWPMNVFFRGKPQMYFSLGLDF